MAAPSFSDFVELGRVEWLTRRPDLDVHPGSETDMLIAAAAAMADRDVGYTLTRFAAHYLDTATGEDLQRLANDHWRVEFEDATSAVGSVTFSRTTTAASRTIDAGTRIATDPDANGDQQVFVTDDELVLGVGVASGSVDATAQTAGVDGNVDAAEITRILDTLPDDGFTVTNAARFVGGAPAQTDDELRTAVREYVASLRRGTLGALETGAKTVTGVRISTASEDEDTGLVSLYVADYEGNSNATMTAAVEEILVDWKAGGACVEVTGGAVSLQTIVVSLTVRTGTNIPAIAAAVRSSIAAAVNQLAIGETLTRVLISTAARNVDRLRITDVTVTTPAANVEPAAGEVIRTMPSLVSVS